MKKRIIALLMTAVLSLQPCFIINADDFSDNIDVSDDINVSEEMGEVQSDSDIEENWNEENSQFEADEIVEDDIYSEDKMDDQDNPEIEVFGIDNEANDEENDNEPVTFTDEVNSKDGIYVGILNQVCWSQSESENVALMIDGHKYYVTNNVNLIIDRFAGEQVVYTLANGKIDNIEPVTELLQPSVSVNATPDSFFYQNGSYSTDKITATVNISCIYQTYSQYFGASKYTKEELEKIADLSVPVKQIDLKLGDHLNFGTTGMILKKEITEVSEKKISLSLKNPISYKYEVYVEKNYVPIETTAKSTLSVTLVKEDNTTIKCKDAVISIGNQDQQQKQLVAKNSNTDKSKVYTEMQKKLVDCTAIALDAGLGEYFSKEQIDEMERFVAVYVAEVINADQMEDPNFFQQVADNLRKKVRDNILKKLHVSYSSFLFYKSSDIVIDMEAETKSNGTAKIKFNIPISSYSAGDESPFASMAPINYSVSAGTSLLVSGTGVITYTDMKAFANTMLDYMKIAYDKAWGEDANKIASMFVQEPINTLMDGDYSGKIYKLARKAAGEKTDVKSEAAKQTSNFIYRYVKKAIIHCPVDVYVYDEADNLCASVVNNEIVSDSNEVLLVVNGDEKYVYLTKDTYKIRLKGTAHGTMEYCIQEYQDGNCIRSVETANIPLEKGTEYTAIIPAVPRIDSSLYRLKDQNNTEIIETSDTYDDSDEDEEEIVSRLIEASGTCGESARWVLYEDGEMVIYGTGRISYGGWEKAKLKKVEIIRGVTGIGAWTFSNCSSIEHITIPDTVTEIGCEAFEICMSLTTVSGGNKLKKIEDKAFRKCIQLESITIPASVEYYGRDVFEGCTSLKTLGSINEDYDIKFGFKEEIPAYFFAKSALEEISIPDTVTKIGYEAFWNCKSLIAVVGGNKLERIEGGAFSGCEHLKSITIPASVIKFTDGYVFDEYIFGGCTELKTLGPIDGDYNIKYEFTEEIPGGLFWGSEIEEVNIPDTVKNVGDYAFYNCSNLKDIKISSELLAIKYRAFSYCNSLKNIVIPDTVTEIGQEAFGYCKNLITVSGGNKLKRLGGSAFSGCVQLESITIPESVESCGNGIFEKCTNLKTAGPINGNYNIKLGFTEEIPGGLFGKSEIEEISIPDTVESILPYAFYECSNLKKVKLSSTLTYIGYYTFGNCNSLETIVIPNTVTQIGNEAFWQSNNLSIYGHTGSYAEKYAKENNIPFVDLDGKKDNITVTPAVEPAAKPTIKPTSTPQKPSSKPSGNTATKEPAVLKLNVTTVTLQKRQSTTGLKITSMAKWDSVVSWKSSNTKIVKVSKTGKLTAQNKTGKATVTVTLKSGLSKKVTVKVQKNAVTTTSLKILNKATGKTIAKKVTLKRKEKLSLSAVTAPITSKQKVTYKSSKKSVATVNSKGVVTAKKKGKATITVKSGKKTVKIQVTVK